MAKVTIIVPIYNVEKYLPTCFDSLMKQTYTDFVVMAVNDGSPANEQEIIEEYAKRYDQIIPIQKENGGYGSVLQLAIEKCETEYFLICDPDDYLEENALALLVEQAEKHQSDLTAGAKYYIYEDSDDQDFTPSYNTEYVTLRNEVPYFKKTNQYNDLFFLDASPHTKLYRTSLARFIQFPRKISYTDSVLFFLYMLKAKKVVYTDQARAYYLINRTGNTTSDVAPKLIIQNVQAYESILEQAEQLEDIPNFFYYRMFETYKYLFQMLRRIDGEKSEVDKAVDALKSLLKKLVKKKKAILTYYKRYNKYRKNEQKLDRLSLSSVSSLSDFSFNHSVKKLLNEKKAKEN